MSLTATNPKILSAERCCRRQRGSRKGHVANVAASRTSQPGEVTAFTNFTSHDARNRIEHESYAFLAQTGGAAANCAALAHEADEKEKREYYIRMRDAWIGLANRCQFHLSDEQPGATVPQPPSQDARRRTI